MVKIGKEKENKTKQKQNKTKQNKTKQTNKETNIKGRVEKGIQIIQEEER